jgi:hypothetical protein
VAQTETVVFDLEKLLVEREEVGRFVADGIEFPPGVR